MILAKKQKNSLTALKRKKARMCYLMLALPIIGFLVFKIYPILWTFRWSFFRYTGVPSETDFIGLENFKTIFTSDNSYWKAWLNTLEFTIIKVPIEIFMALILANILSAKGIKFKSFFRSVYFMPNILSIAIVGLIFSNIFSTNGFANALIKFLGGNPIQWLGTKTSAMSMLIIGAIWNGFGINVLYIIAALSNVSNDLYEAADIDGAGTITKFFKITIPMIAPVFKTIILLSLLATLGVNEYIIVLTGGAPANSTRSVMSYLTTKFVPGFMEDATPNLGYGCALSLITTILFGICSLIYQKLSNKEKIS